jgi:hypothetical protein
MTLPPPLVPGTVRPREGTAGIGVNALTLIPVASFPTNPDNGMVVTLASDGVTYQYTNSTWLPIGTPASGGYLTKAQADLYYRQKATYVFTQLTPASVWTIAHGLSSMPVPIVQDSAGTTVEGNVQYVDLNTMILTFAAPFSGKAYLA